MPTVSPMQVFKCLKIVKEDESGAVTVDWVVLTAAVVVLGSGVVSVISPGLTSTSSYITSQIVSSTN